MPRIHTRDTPLEFFYLLLFDNYVIIMEKGSLPVGDRYGKR